jgi:hypothetical protein
MISSVHLLILACLGAFVFANPISLDRNVPNKDCGFPNNTDTRFYAYNCDKSYAIQVIDEEVYDNDTLKPMYPIDVTKKILIELKSQNNGDVYQDNKVDVDLAEYSYSFIHDKCQWNTIPTFGLL